jgi:hypothetical protein
MSPVMVQGSLIVFALAVVLLILIALHRIGDEIARNTEAVDRIADRIPGEDKGQS